MKSLNDCSSLGLSLLLSEFLSVVVDTTGKDARAAYEDRRAQQAALIKQLMRAAVSEAKRSLGEDSKVDGDATSTRGPCDCGFRHWCDGREVDFVYPIETSKGAKIIGYSLTGAAPLVVPITLLY